MENTITFFIVLIACYLIGSIPFGLILSRLTGHGDIRESGSGNIGATNVYRTANKKLGILTLFLDALKGGGPLFLTLQYFSFTEIQTAAIVVALFLGHCYSIYLGFKGGKGVATALGLYLVLSPLAVVETLILFVFIVWKSRYISMGSVCAAILSPFLIFFHLKSYPYLAATVVVSFIVVIRHQENIKRIASGTESKFKH